MTSHRRRDGRAAGLTAAALAVGLAASTLAPAAALEPDWTRVGTGMTGGVSGLASLGSTDWVLVRDNKIEGQNRIAILRAGGSVVDLGWPGTDPSDLESISTVPGATNRYAVVTSNGSGHVIDIDDTSLTVVRSFALPAGRKQNEGFALVRMGAATVAVWGNRGSTTAPGRLFTATFDAETAAFGPVSNRPVTVSYPTTAVRHISDLVVVGGRVVVASTSDPGVNGPFASAVHDVAALTLVAGRPRLTTSTPQELSRHADHKVEGLGCNGTTGLMGSDDERAGGWVAATDICG